jgi:hypothetical protein
MHSGNMGLTQRLDVLIESTRDPSWPKDAVLLLVGDGAARTRLVAQADSLVDRDESGSGEESGSGRTTPKRVFFLPYQPRERLSESLSAADLHVVSMHEEITGCLCPSKLYGILAAGRPVLAIAPDKTDLAKTVRKHQVGHVALPGDTKGIATQVAGSLSVDHADQTQRCRDLALMRDDRRVVLETLTQALTQPQCQNEY